MICEYIILMDENLYRMDIVGFIIFLQFYLRDKLQKCYRFKNHRFNLNYLLNFI